MAIGAAEDLYEYIYKSGFQFPPCLQFINRFIAHCVIFKPIVFVSVSATLTVWSSVTTLINFVHKDVHLPS